MQRWDLVFWEAELNNGQVQREADGVKYGDINRPRLKEFRLVCMGEDLVKMAPPTGATGRNLVYRRRVSISQDFSQPRSVYLVGWVPMGPVLLLDPATDTYRVEQSFVEGDPDMAMPALRPHEGEEIPFAALKGTRPRVDDPNFVAGLLRRKG